MTSKLVQFVARLTMDKTFSHPYHGVLITSGYKSEKVLFGMLWAGAGLIFLMTWLHMQTQSSHMDVDTSLRPPPRKANGIATEQAKPWIALKTNNNDSLFQLAKQDAPASQPVAASGNINQQPNKPVQKTGLWQLHIQRPTISEAMVINEVADAMRQLQSGDVNLVQQTLRALLIRDPHNVEAMQGMRLAARQLGDAESEQKYLEMLRLEIPDYDLERDGALIGGLD